MFKKVLMMVLISLLAMGCSQKEPMGAPQTPETAPVPDESPAGPIADAGVTLSDAAKKVSLSLDMPVIQPKVLLPAEAKDPSCLAAHHGYTRHVNDRLHEKYEIKLRNPDVTGGIDKRIIQKIVRSHLDELKSCYAAACLASTARLNGSIELSWTVLEQGTADNVQFTADTEDLRANPALGKCFTDAIQHWDFPVPHNDSAANIRYPMGLVDPTYRSIDALPLILSRYDVNAQISGQRAAVKTEFTLTSQDTAELEGVLEFRLPENAVMASYAIDVSGASHNYDID